MSSSRRTFQPTQRILRGGPARKCPSRRARSSRVCREGTTLNETAFGSAAGPMGFLCDAALQCGGAVSERRRGPPHCEAPSAYGLPSRRRFAMRRGGERGRRGPPHCEAPSAYGLPSRRGFAMRRGGARSTNGFEGVQHRLKRPDKPSWPTTQPHAA